MVSRVVFAEDRAQAWRIALLTLIVLIVGCSRSKTPTAPPPPNAAAVAVRDSAQHEVNAAQTKVDDLGATLTKLEVELETLKGQSNPGNAAPRPDSKPSEPDALANDISAKQAQIAHQRAEIDRATKELAERKISLQKAQQEANSLRNDPDKR